MTTPIFPYAVWASGTTQNSIPANDNSLRNEIINRAALSIANAAPGSPADGDVHIVGTAWGAFSTDDVVLYRGGLWYGYAPFEGWLKWLVSDESLYLYSESSSGWSPFSIGGTIAAENVTFDGSESGALFENVQQFMDYILAEDPENNEAANVGAGAGLFKGKNGSALEFKSLVAGTGVTLTPGTDSITIAASGAFGSAVTALSIASGVVNVDCALGDYFTLSLTANVTSLTFSNLPASGVGRSISVRMRQDATGSRTFALPASLKAITGSDIAVQSAANAYTVLMMTTFDAGTRWEYSMKGAAA